MIYALLFPFTLLEKTEILVVKYGYTKRLQNLNPYYCTNNYKTKATTYQVQNEVNFCVSVSTDSRKIKRPFLMEVISIGFFSTFSAKGCDLVLQQCCLPVKVEALQLLPGPANSEQDFTTSSTPHSARNKKISFWSKTNLTVSL